MKKKIAAAVLTMSTVVALAFSPMNVSAVAETASGDTIEAPKELAPPLVINDEGVNMEVLWVAEAGTYDARANGLEVHAPETLVAGKTYDVAVSMTNTTGDDVAMPWGMDYTIRVPRIIRADGSDQAIYGSVRPDARNESEWNYSRATTLLASSEDVALVYKDQSQTAFSLHNGVFDDSIAGGCAGFSWSGDTNLLIEDVIYLQGSRQGLKVGDSEIITFQVEAIPLVDWQSFEQGMKLEPARVEVTDVSQSLIDSRNKTITASIHLPEWLIDLMDDENSYWRVMVCPELSDDGSVAVCARIENHSAAYIVAQSEAVEIDAGYMRGNFEGFEFINASFDGERQEQSQRYNSLDGVWASCYKQDYDFSQESELEVIMTVRTR